MGIEPTRLAWKARILPLNYTRIVKAKFTSFAIEQAQLLIFVSLPLLSKIPVKLKFWFLRGVLSKPHSVRRKETGTLQTQHALVF